MTVDQYHIMDIEEILASGLVISHKKSYNLYSKKKKKKLHFIPFVSSDGVDG